MSSVKELEEVIAPAVRDLSEEDVRQLLEWIAKEHARARAVDENLKKR